MRRGRSICISTAVAVLCAAALTACGSDDDGGGGGDTGGEARNLKVGLTAIGPRNDKAFSQSHVEGAERAEQELEGVELTGILDNRESPQDRIDAFETLATTNDVVVGASASYAPTADTVAPQFPDAWFVVSGGGLTERLHENVTTIVQEPGPQGYAAGYVSAEMTKTGVIGVIGGAEIPPTEQTVAGFAEGAKERDPDVEVLQTVIGNFNDAAKAKEVAAAMIGDGADHIFGYLDAGMTGVYQAANESGKEVGVFNIIVPACDAYDNLIGTATENDSDIVFEAIKRFQEGTLKPGAVFIGMQDPRLMTIELCPKYAEDEKMSSLVEETIRKINEGELKPSDAVVTARPDFDYTEGFDGGQ